MTRVEQIEQAWFARMVQSNHLYDEKSFKDGISWADANPAWHNADEELPEKPCMCVCHDGERMFFAEWVDNTERGGLSGWSINGLTNQPIAWLPLPKFTPKA